MRLGKFVQVLALTAPMAIAAVACSDDPTDEGSGDPFAIVTSFSEGTRSVGTAFTITGKVVDRLGTPLPIQLTVTSGAASVAIDSTRFVTELQETRVYARAVAASAGTSVVFTGGALSDTVTVVVN